MNSDLTVTGSTAIVVFYLTTSPELRLYRVEVVVEIIIIIIIIIIVVMVVVVVVSAATAVIGLSKCFVSEMKQTLFICTLA
jgi:hypothetical protein